MYAEAQDRVAALENAARELLGLPTLRPPTQWVTGAGGIPSAEAFGGTTVVIGGTAVERDIALSGTVKRAFSRVSGGGDGMTRGVRIERRGVRVRLTARRVVVVTTRELGCVIGAAVGGIANPSNGRAAAAGLLIGYGVGWLWDSYGPGPDQRLRFL